ncbi:hypothetical protein C7B62_09145 [Pleurocapsa sp. CCALA 161]|uniref:hypothetical protein n=1 Tax=Pleurocapsa sp. CCALA 161 TaxID=2107688 RepID=UPI000D057FFE|nr:hypothetical protein [Pleurocapsa sp. CCALA 161]PSB10513.1 hypothetical protein C7B62_09145 [Pleurocapsa sp. CCALA 161]
MNNYQATTKKVIALFLSLGMMSSLVGCDAGDTENEDGEGTSIEQPAPTQDEGGEGGEGGEGDEGGEDD